MLDKALVLVLRASVFRRHDCGRRLFGGSRRNHPLLQGRLRSACGSLGVFRLRAHLLHYNIASHVALHTVLAQAGRVLILVEQDHGFEGVAVDGRAWLFRWLLFCHPFVLSQALELVKVVVFHLAV